MPDVFSSQVGAVYEYSTRAEMASTSNASHAYRLAWCDETGGIHEFVPNDASTPDGWMVIASTGTQTGNWLFRSENFVVRPLGAGQDDSTRLLSLFRSAAGKAAVYLLGTFTWSTPGSEVDPNTWIANNSKIYGFGREATIIQSTLTPEPVHAHQNNSPFYSFGYRDGDGVASTTLAAPLSIDDESFLVNSVTNFVVGQNILVKAMSIGSDSNIQQFIIREIDPIEKRIYIDRPSKKTAQTGEPVLTSPGAYNITIAHLTVTGTGDRAVEFICARNCLLYDVNVDGRSGGIFTYFALGFDYGAQHCTFDHCSVNAVVSSQQNLAVFSQAFAAGSNWQKNAGALVVDNAAVAPDGTTTASSLTFNGSYVQENIGVTVGQIYTFSIWLKADANCSTNIVLGDANTGNPATTTSCSLTTNWQRFSATVVGSAVTNLVAMQIFAAAGRIVYMWGSQLTQGAGPEAYIATTNTQINRNCASNCFAFESAYSCDMIDCTAEGSLAYNMLFSECDDCQIERGSSVGCYYGPGVQLSNGSNSDAGCTGCIIEDVTISSNNIGVLIMDESRENQIVNCLVEDSMLDGLRVGAFGTGANPPKRTSVIGGTYRNNGLHGSNGIQFASGQDNKIRSACFDNNAVLVTGNGVQATIGADTTFENTLVPFVTTNGGVASIEAPPQVTTTSAGGDANYTYTFAEYVNLTIIDTSTVTLPRDRILPTLKGLTRIVKNATAQTITYKSSGQNGVAVSTGMHAWIFCNGTDWERVTTDA